MSELVADDAQVTGKVREVDAITITVHHLDSVPEGVVVVLVVVDGRDQSGALVVVRVATKGLKVELVADARVGVRLVDRLVVDRQAALSADEGARQLGLLVGSVDRAVLDRVHERELDDEIARLRRDEDARRVRDLHLGVLVGDRGAVRKEGLLLVQQEHELGDGEELEVLLGHGGRDGRLADVLDLLGR